jgi:hypothetical protein
MHSKLHVRALVGSKGFSQPSYNNSIGRSDRRHAERSGFLFSTPVLQDFISQAWVIHFGLLDAIRGDLNRPPIGISKHLQMLWMSR